MSFRTNEDAARELAHQLVAEVERERERAEAAEQALAAIVRDRDHLQVELAHAAMRRPPTTVQLPMPPGPDDIDPAASTLKIALQLLALVTVAVVIAVIIANTGP